MNVGVPVGGFSVTVVVVGVPVVGDFSLDNWKRTLSAQFPIPILNLFNQIFLVSHVILFNKQLSDCNKVFSCVFCIKLKFRLLKFSDECKCCCCGITSETH